jgi:plastocyanin
MGKTALTILIIVIIIIVGYLIWGDEPAKTEEPNLETVNQEMPVVGSNTPEMIVEAGKNIQEFDISGAPFKFSVKEIRVKQGDTVRINFTNSEGLHDWVVDEFNARTKQLQAGTSETVEFVADKKGEFEYYCSVGTHRAQGMVGKLIVE